MVHWRRGPEVLGRLRRPGDLLLEIEGVRSLAPTRSTDRLSLRLTGRVESVEVVGVFRAPSRLHRWGAYADSGSSVGHAGLPKPPVAGSDEECRGLADGHAGPETLSASIRRSSRCRSRGDRPKPLRGGESPPQAQPSAYSRTGPSGQWACKGSSQTPVLGDRRLPYVIPAAHGAQIGLAGREQVARKRRPKHGIRGNVPPLNVSLDLSVADQRNRSFRTVQPIMLTVDLRNLTPCETVDLCLVLVGCCHSPGSFLFNPS